MVIIFLDIDGVLNQLQRNYFIDRKCVERLGKICNSIDGKIVLTSSWRLGYTRLGKCSPQIERLKEMFNEYNIEIIGRTSNLNDRTNEIKEYMIKHNVNNYIILDDDIREFKSGRLDKTEIIDNKTGLTDKDVKRIIKTYKR